MAFFFSKHAPTAWKKSPTKNHVQSVELDLCAFNFQLFWFCVLTGVCHALPSNTSPTNRRRSYYYYFFYSILWLLLLNFSRGNIEYRSRFHHGQCAGWVLPKSKANTGRAAVWMVQRVANNGRRLKRCSRSSNKLHTKCNIWNRRRRRRRRKSYQSDIAGWFLRREWNDNEREESTCSSFFSFFKVLNFSWCLCDFFGCCYKLLLIVRLDTDSHKRVRVH